MVERKEYLTELASWKDEQVIKVVTGLRRCGSGNSRHEVAAGDLCARNASADADP